MPPKKGESIERTDEYDEFVKKVAGSHEERGTSFEPEPKVGVRHIDLLKLYKRVVEEGGYDLVSDTKAKPLMWRRLAEEFIGKNQYTAAQAFQIKNVYYKNLCAFEIKTHWGKEPPPKEILEEVTAKGGNVMSRTLDNFARPPIREQVHLDGGEASDGSPGQGTPKEEATDDDPSGSTGRTRGLRQQPPQRVLFQPDLTAARHTRGQSSTTLGSPAPAPPGIHGMSAYATLSNGASSTLASYEPSHSYPLSLKPVITPANNPEFYRLERKRKLEASASPLAKKYKNIMLPGTGFIGPNIYVRAQLALQSNIADEEQYALHHLVKISHERGDKYRFDQFPGLADALVKKALQVSSLFYDVEWDISYDDEYMITDDETLSGLRGTSDIIQRVRSRIPLAATDSIQDADFVSQLNRITEAGLILRNMCMLDENARYLSRQPMTRDYLAIVLDLPESTHTIELQQYALETAEQVLRYCDLGPHDALYSSLLMQLDREDRTAIVLALRTISRIAMHLPPPKRLESISDDMLQRVQDWLLVEDEELRSACLDFLMQYTSFADNVDHLLMAIDATGLVTQLTGLLFSSAKEHREGLQPPRIPRDDGSPAVPRLSQTVVEGLLKLDEPERSSEWLRMCFLPDSTSEMTQISLWQAYQATFAAHQASHPHLIAGDFIKNVSNTFPGATAQVAGSNKYVIRGIKSRKVPIVTGAMPGSKMVDKGKELHKCCWRMIFTTDPPRDPLTGIRGPSTTSEGECNEWFRPRGDLLKHILTTHLRIPKTEAGGVSSENQADDDLTPAQPLSSPSQRLLNGTTATTFDGSLDFEGADDVVHECKWSFCKRRSDEFEGTNAQKLVLFARHVQTHLPNASPIPTKHNLQPDAWRNSTTLEATYYTTLQDEKNDAAGVPLGAALVLRNITKFMPRDLPSDQRGEGVREVLGGERTLPKEPRNNGPTDQVFDRKVKETLFHAAVNQRTIKGYIGPILRAVAQST